MSRLKSKESEAYCATEGGINSVVLDKAWELGRGVCCRQQVRFMTADELTVFGHHDITLHK